MHCISVSKYLLNILVKGLHTDSTYAPLTLMVNVYAYYKSTSLAAVKVNKSFTYKLIQIRFEGLNDANFVKVFSYNVHSWKQFSS